MTLDTPAPSEATAADATRTFGGVGWPGWLVIVGSTVAAYLAVGPFLPDDAFIHLRYAENLFEGHGWVYNEGEISADGMTSPMFVGLVALVALVVRSVEVASDVVFVASMVVAGWATYRIIGRERPFAAGFSSLLLLTSPWLGSTRGMESWLFVAIASVAVLAARERRPVLAGLLAGMLGLVRGEGLLLVLLLAGQLWVRDRRAPVRFAAAAVVPLATWIAYSVALFGTPLPGTLTAKIAQGKSGFWGEGLLYLRGFVDITDKFRFGIWVLTLLGLLAIAAFAGASSLARHRPSLREGLLRLLGTPGVATIVVLALGVVGAYGLVFRVPAYHWYYATPVHAAVLVAGLGVAWLARRSTVALVLTGVLVAAIGVTGLRSTPDDEPVPGYIAAAEWFHENVPPEASIAATEIGGLGYHVPNPIVDYLGLLSDQAAEHLAEGDLAWWIEAFEPDYWLVHDPLWSFELQAAETEYFADNYLEFARVDAFVVHRRRGAPTS